MDVPPTPTHVLPTPTHVPPTPTHASHTHSCTANAHSCLPCPFMCLPRPLMPPTPTHLFLTDHKQVFVMKPCSWKQNVSVVIQKLIIYFDYHCVMRTVCIDIRVTSGQTCKSVCESRKETLLIQKSDSLHSTCIPALSLSIYLSSYLSVSHFISVPLI